jgi:hypothetical protein
MHIFKHTQRLVLNQQITNLTRRHTSFVWPCPRKLTEIVKTSAFEKETAETCTMIWKEYHHAKPHTVSTVLTAPLYAELMSKGKGAPMFIYPVPKGEAPNHFVLVSQHQAKSFVSSFRIFSNILYRSSRSWATIKEIQPQPIHIWCSLASMS